MAIGLTRIIRRIFTAPAVGQVRLGGIVGLTGDGVESTRGGRKIGDAYIASFLGANGASLAGRTLFACTRDVSLPETCITELERIGADELNEAALFAAGEFDCAVLIEVLAMVDDPAGVLRKISVALREGAVLLATLPGVARDEPGFNDTYQWRFSQNAAKRLFTEAFPSSSVNITTFGNVFTAVASATGLSADLLSQRELAKEDGSYPVTIGVRALR